MLCTILTFVLSQVFPSYCDDAGAVFCGRVLGGGVFSRDNNTGIDFD